MQLSGRVGSCVCVHSRPFAATWRRFTAPSSSLSASSAKEARVRVSVDNECKDFLPWLERKAGVEISSLLSIGKSTHGRCLMASKAIREGELVLKVPFSVQLSEDNITPEIRSALGDEVGNVSKLALLLLIEQRKGQDSEWAPYIERLPCLSEMHNTILWSNNELQMISQSSASLETNKLKAQVKRDFVHIERVVGSLTKVLEDISFHDFVHAYTLVTSRAWESQNHPSLIPFADFVNHDGTSEAYLLGDVDKQCSEVIADRDYNPGEQVMIIYGKFSNSTLLLDFGFTVPSNVYDQVCIVVDIPSQDPLRMKKTEILQKHYTPPVKDINCFSSSWNSFIIKEVRLTSKNGRGIPQSLWAFARVLCSSSLEELHNLDMDATNKDGRLARIPLKDESKECLAHQLLIALIKRRIEEYDESIKLLEAQGYSASPTRGGSYDVRRLMAMDLLKGECRILISAHAWLKARDPTQRLECDPNLIQC